MRQELQLLIQVSEARVRIRFKLSRSDPFFDRGPPVVCFAAFLQIGCAESGLRQVFGINDHQFLTLLFIQQVLHPTETLGILALVCLDETLHPKAFH